MLKSAKFSPSLTIQGSLTKLLTLTFDGIEARAPKKLKMGSSKSLVSDLNGTYVASSGELPGLSASTQVFAIPDFPKRKINWTVKVIKKTPSSSEYTSSPMARSFDFDIPLDLQAKWALTQLIGENKVYTKQVDTLRKELEAQAATAVHPVDPDDGFRFAALSPKSTFNSVLKSWVDDIVSIVATKVPNELKSVGQKQLEHPGDSANYLPKSVYSQGVGIFTNVTPAINLRTGATDWKVLVLQEGAIVFSQDRSFKWDVSAGTQVKWALDTLAQVSKKFVTR
jgi:hypothetical protein